MMVHYIMNSTRRHWFSTCLAMAAWADVLSAQQHAHNDAGSATLHFENLDPAAAAEVEAIANQIIPSTDGPGAREAGVIYFIDRALSTFAADDRESYRAGMAQLQQKRQELFPNSTTIASLTDQQQITLIRAIEASEFFELLRTHTVLGFLGNPSYGGNRGEIGWKQIGFEDRMMYQPPFGYYDAQVNGEEEVSGMTFPTSDAVDFLVLGAGAAGGVVAKELSTAGFSVVVLEQGPYLREKDYTHDEIKYTFQPGLTNDPKTQPITYRKSEAETRQADQGDRIWAASGRRQRSFHRQLLALS